MDAHQLPRITEHVKEEFDRQVEEAIREDGDRGPLLLAWHGLLEEENPLLLEVMKSEAQKHADPALALYDFLMLYGLLHFHTEDEPHVLH